MIDSSKLPGRKSKEWTTKSIKAYVMLMMLFLRASPSYALAHAFATKKTRSAQQAQLIARLYQGEKQPELQGTELEEVLADFARVRKTYEEFGDIYTVDFEEWWDTRALKIYGFEGLRPKVRKIAFLAEGNQVSDDDKKALRKYLHVIRPAEATPPALLLSVPLGVSKDELLNQVSKLIDAEKVPVKRKAQMAKRPFTAKRLRSEPLFLGLKLLWAKAKFPKMPLWRLGALLNVSPRNDLEKNRLDLTTFRDDSAVRANLAILTHRMLKKAQTIAENAARGDYPSNNKCRLPKFEPKHVSNRINKSKRIIRSATAADVSEELSL